MSEWVILFLSCVTFLSEVSPTASHQNQSSYAWLKTTTGRNPLISSLPLRLPSACTWSCFLFLSVSVSVCECVCVWVLSSVLRVRVCVFCMWGSECSLLQPWFHLKLPRAVRDRNEKNKETGSIHWILTVGRRARERERKTEGGLEWKVGGLRNRQDETQRGKQTESADEGYAFMHWSVKSPVKRKLWCEQKSLPCHFVLQLWCFKQVALETIADVVHVCVCASVRVCVCVCVCVCEPFLLLSGAMQS